MEVVKVKNHRLAADNPDHFVVHDEGGEEFKVAKHSLDPLTKEKIANLQKVEGYDCGGPVKMADGGPVPQKSDYAQQGDQAALEDQHALIDSLKEPAQAPGLSPQENLDLKGRAAEQSSIGRTEPGYTAPPVPTPLVQPQAPQDNSAQWAGAPKVSPADVVVRPPTDPQAAQQDQGMSPMYIDAAKQALGAAQGQSDTMQMVGKQVAQSYQKSYSMMKDVQDHYKTTLDRLNNQAEQLIADGTAGKIDPNHYWNSMSTPNKIVSAISMMIGGMGSFATGGRNLAGETIEKAIDNDINAQKANIANKDNLLSKNIALTGSMTQALDATRAQLTAMAAAQVGAAESLNIGPKAKKDLADYKLQLMQNVMQQNMLQAKQSSMMRLNGLSSQQATPQDLALNPEMAGSAVKLPTGHIGIAYSPDEGKELRDSISRNKTVFNILDRLEEMGPEAVINPRRRDEAKGLMSSLKIALSQSQDYKRYSEGLMKEIEGQFDDPTEWKRVVGLDSQNKTSLLKKTMLDTLLNEMGAKLRNYEPPPIPRKSPK